jgi:uncharacterized protein
MSHIIGRKSEQKLLQQAIENKAPELIAVYGRRRIGKTFLIREFFKKDIVFEVVGLADGLMKDQIENFCKTLIPLSKKKEKTIPSNWFEAFQLLEQKINRLKSEKKKVIFIDEFPWMATPKSKFLTAFENFWNSYCTKRNDLIVVICGSAAAYMVQKIIRNKRGLHNRITRHIRLLPFTLAETRDFIQKKGVRYSHYDITQLYMAIGGIPHYLEKIQKGMSVAQNIDRLCFEKDGSLHNEFNMLFTSLFDNSEKHIKIIKALAGNNKGLTRTGISEKTKIPSGGDLTLKIDELTESGFVSEYPFYQNKKQLSLYRLSDEYSKFYLKFIENNTSFGEGTWLRLHQKQSYKSWAGIAFENICLKHVSEIKKALRIDAIYSQHSSWFNKNAQIDLLIDRDDNVINLCEMKFYNDKVTIDKRLYNELKNKATTFENTTKTRKNIFITLITTFGLNANEYSNEIVHNQLILNDLF